MFEFLCWLFVVLTFMFLATSDAEQHAQISSARIEVAQKLCAERGVEWISLRKVKCKDNSVYTNYYVETN
jgi:hypothetical protein